MEEEGYEGFHAVEDPCVLNAFRLSGILRKPITAPLMQNGELKAFKPHQVESYTVVQYSQPVLQKNGIIVHGLYTY